MKKLMIPLAAVLIGIVAAVAGFNSLKNLPNSRGPSGPLTEIGQITEAKGDVQHRLPHSFKIEPVSSPTSYHAQEWLITGRDSNAIVVFNNATSLRLAGDTRIVAEPDPGVSEGIVVTLLSGDVALASPGDAHQLRVLRNGEEYKLYRGSPVPMVPLIRPGAGSGSASTDTSATPLPAVTATTADETATVSTPPPAADATPPRVLPSYKQPGQSDAPSNADIQRQLRMQTSFFQRCYLTFINRTKVNKETAPTGTVVVGFTIQPNGKVNGVKVVRSDFKDQTLHKCLTEVIERTPFKAFNADAVPVSEFPISLK